MCIKQDIKKPWPPTPFERINFCLHLAPPHRPSAYHVYRQQHVYTYQSCCLEICPALQNKMRNFSDMNKLPKAARKNMNRYSAEHRETTAVGK